MIDPALIVSTLYIAAALSLLGIRFRRINDVFALIASGFAFVAVSLNFVLPFGGTSLFAGVGFNFTINGYTNFIALIAAVIGFLVLVYSIMYIEHRQGLYSFLTLLTIGSLIGMAYSWNLFWLFLLAEFSTICSAYLIAHHQKAQHLEGAIKYLIIQIFVSFFMVVGLALCYQLAVGAGYTGIGAFSIELLLSTGVLVGFEGKLAVFLIFIGFLVKLPSFPMHTWLPDASTVAPASISTLLHAMMIKVAGMPAFLILLTFNSLFVSINFWLLVCTFGALTMFICVVIAFAQDDLKRLLAFDSVSQMGYVILGIGIGGLALSYYNITANPLWLGVTAGGISAGLFHLLNHSLFKSVLFFSAGAVEHGTGTKDLNKLGGLLRSMPTTSYVMLIGSLSVAGIPLLNGFISKWMVYNACIAAGQPVFAFVAIFTSTLTFAVFLRLLCSVFLGNPSQEIVDVHPAPKSMIAPSVVLAAGCILFGVLPQLPIIVLVYPATLGLLPIAVIPPVDLFAILFFFGGAWNPFLITTLVLIGLVMGYLLYRFRWGAKPVDADDKTMPFTGGTLEAPYLKIDEVRPASTVFAYPFRSLLNAVRKSHTGSVNMYLLWIVIFIVFLLIGITVGWI
jgi:multicomponent Na+:H+ antiporter subunit D